CGSCMKPGCPAMTRGEGGKVVINDTMCNGCGLCAQLCPFGAIEKVEV
ncbi:MAG: 4Fe-4S binding protein, partial [Lachnospiraceae bacterium]|nr:4Fe-4S binding protein [Lachnospiraceae bacterium]